MHTLKNLSQKSRGRMFFAELGRNFLPMLCKMQKMNYFQKRLDKLSAEVFHRHFFECAEKKLDLSRFSTLSTEFSIGLARF